MKGNNIRTTNDHKTSILFNANILSGKIYDLKLKVHNTLGSGGRSVFLPCTTISFAQEITTFICLS